MKFAMIHILSSANREKLRALRGIRTNTLKRECLGNGSQVPFEVSSAQPLSSSALSTYRKMTLFNDSLLRLAGIRPLAVELNTTKLVANIGDCFDRIF